MPSGDKRVAGGETSYLLHLPAAVSIPLVAAKYIIRRQLKRKKASQKDRD